MFTIKANPSVAGIATVRRPKDYAESTEPAVLHVEGGNSLNGDTGVPPQSAPKDSAEAAADSSDSDPDRCVFPPQSKESQISVLPSRAFLHQCTFCLCSVCAYLSIFVSDNLHM